MSEKNIDSVKSKGFADSILWCVVWVVVALGIYGNYHFATDYSSFKRVLGLCFMGAVAIFIAYLTQKGKSVAALLVGAKAEVQKVVWPSKQEIIQTTIVVVIAVIVVGIMLFGIDSLLGWSIKKMVG
jgi:preprotein translocase subunit SecE